MADQRVLAILSPASVIHLPFFKEQLSRVFPRIDLVAPRDVHHLREIVSRNSKTHGLVLAVGGDGTLHQVLQGLDLEHQVLGILPAGTGNDFARAVGFPRSITASIRRLPELTTRLTDFATLNGIRYVNSGGFGIDSQTLRVRHRGRWVVRHYYLAAFMAALAGLRFVDAQIDCDGELLEGSYAWVLAMNSSRIGGGIPIAPHARLDDGKLDVILVRRMSKWELLQLMPVALRGAHLELPQCTYRQAKSLSVRAEERIDYVALDGEEVFIGERDMRFRIVTDGLRFLR